MRGVAIVARLEGDLRQEAGAVALGEERRGVGHGVEQRIEPAVFDLGEVVQHVVRHGVLGAGMPDADAHAVIVVAHVRGDGAQAVVAGIAAADLHLQLAGREVDLVVKDVDVLDGDFQEARGIADRAAAVVHVGGGLQEHDALAAERAFRRLAMEALAPGAEAVRVDDLVERHVADVVAVAGVLRAWVSQTDEQLHGRAPARRRKAGAR